MDNTFKTAKELKDEQISRIVELAGLLNKAKWFKEDSLRVMNYVDRSILLDNLEAEKAFVDDFCGGDELILKEV